MLMDGAQIVNSGSGEMMGPIFFHIFPCLPCLPWTEPLVRSAIGGERLNRFLNLQPFRFQRLQFPVHFTFAQ